MHAQLRARIASELGREAPAAARCLSEAIVRRHGDAVSAVLFYGSCLRKQTHDGILDFYVLVDDYASAYDRFYLRVANRLVPPNVFYLEADFGAERVRCKYAVLSADAFRRGVSARSRIPYFWARFAQPALLAWVRDEAARELAVDCCTRSVLTLVQRLGPFLPASGDVQRFSPSALWQAAFARTYRSELRTESDETVRSHYEADAARYDELAGHALEALVDEGWLEAVEPRGGAFEVRLSARRRRLARLRWQLERPLCKGLAFVRLFKNTTTFGDWVPYILWKIERHTGRRVEVTERQRRHPFLFGWPVLARLLWQRDIF